MINMVGCVRLMGVLTSNSWCPSCGINFAVRHFFRLSGQNNDTSENDMSLFHLDYARLSLSQYSTLDYLVIREDL